MFKIFVLSAVLFLSGNAQSGVQGSSDTAKYDETTFQQLETILNLKEPGWKFKQGRKGEGGWGSSWTRGGKIVTFFVQQEKSIEKARQNLQIDVYMRQGPTKELNGLGDEAYVQGGFNRDKPRAVRMFFRKSTFAVSLVGTSYEEVRRFADHVNDFLSTL